MKKRHHWLPPIFQNIHLQPNFLQPFLYVINNYVINLIFLECHFLKLVLSSNWFDEATLWIKFNKVTTFMYEDQWRRLGGGAGGAADQFSWLKYALNCIVYRVGGGSTPPPLLSTIWNYAPDEDALNAFRNVNGRCVVIRTPSFDICNLQIDFVPIKTDSMGFYIEIGNF